MRNKIFLLIGVLIGLSIITPIVSALPAGFQEFYTPLPADQTQDVFVNIRRYWTRRYWWTDRTHALRRRGDGKCR